MYVLVNLTSILWLGALALNTIAGLDLFFGLVLLGAAPRALTLAELQAEIVAHVRWAHARGIRNLWFQPGAESPAEVAACRDAGGVCIADGSCLLVVLGYRDDWTP